MVVVKPVSVKIVLLSDRAKPLLVLVVIEPVSVAAIFGIWLALVMATALVDVAAFSIVTSEANEETIGGTTGAAAAAFTVPVIANGSADRSSRDSRGSRTKCSVPAEGVVVFLRFRKAAPRISFESRRRKVNRTDILKLRGTGLRLDVSHQIPT